MSQITQRTELFAKFKLVLISCCGSSPGHSILFIHAHLFVLISAKSIAAVICSSAENAHRARNFPVFHRVRTPLPSGLRIFFLSLFFFPIFFFLPFSHHRSRDTQIGSYSSSLNIQKGQARKRNGSLMQCFGIYRPHGTYYLFILP